MDRRQFNKTVAAAAVTAALAPFGIVRAQATRLKVGVILPRSGVQGFIGQSCQKGADLAPGVIKEILGVDIELMNADWESNVDTARTRAERLVQEGAHVLVGPFDSQSAFISSMSTPSISLMTPGARSAPFWHDCPMKPCTPERGRMTPTLRRAAWARTMPNGENAAVAPAAAAARLNWRRSMTPPLGV